MTTKRKAAKSAKKSKKTTSKRPAKKMSPSAALSVATSSKKTVKQRVDAMPLMSLDATKTDDNPQAIMKVLRDTNEPVRVRLAALESLARAAFSAPAFDSWRTDYIGTLREVSTDADPEIRQRALGLLARENDGYVQKKLLEGLKNPDKALVPPEKALQLLSYDVHNEAYAVARDIVANPPNPDAKREAVRLLAADPASAPLFEKLLRDKDELREIRQISASALHVLRPVKLKEHAREIVMDAKDYPDIKATSLTALTQFGDEEEVAKDKTLLEKVDRLSEQAPAKVKKTARRFLTRFKKD